MRLEPIITCTRALGRVTLDSSRLEDVLTVSEIMSVGRMPTLVAQLESTEEGRAILRERPRLDTRSVDFAALRALPVGTLGRTYVDHLDRCGLDPDLLAAPITRGDGPLSNYMFERTRQTHDILHALLGLGVEPYEEVLLNAFQWSQTHLPWPAVVVVLGFFKHFVGERRTALLRHGLADALRAGRRAAPLFAVYWERHWEEPLSRVHERLQIEPASRWRGYSLAALERFGDRPGTAEWSRAWSGC